MPIFRASSNASREDNGTLSLVKMDAGTSILRTIERSFGRPCPDGQRSSSGQRLQQLQLHRTSRDPANAVCRQLQSMAPPPLSLTAPLPPPDVASTKTCFQITESCQQLFNPTHPSNRPGETASSQEGLLTGPKVSQTMTFGISVDLETTMDSGIYLNA